MHHFDHDPDDDEGSGGHAGQQWAERMFGEYGWDSFEERFGDCSMSTGLFSDAVDDLRAALRSESVHADTDREITELTRMYRKSWARFVDPALSLGGSEGGANSVVVLYECSDHVVALHRTSRDWAVFVGLRRIYDLQAQLVWMYDSVGSDEDDEENEAEAELSPESTSHIADLSEEDLELRELREEDEAPGVDGTSTTSKFGDPPAGGRPDPARPCDLHGLVECGRCWHDTPRTGR